MVLERDGPFAEYQMVDLSALNETYLMPNNVDDSDKTPRITLLPICLDRATSL